MSSPLPGAGEQYLLAFESYFDIDGEYAGVIVVFATSADLLKLFEASVVVVDGTFKIKPVPYARERSAQVFTLNTYIQAGDYLDVHYA